MTEPTIHRHPAIGNRLAVRVDGEWMGHAAEYGPILVFWDDPDEMQIDVGEDTVAYSDDDQHHRPVDLHGYALGIGVAKYKAPDKLPIDIVEVHDVAESDAHRLFYGESR